MMRPITLGAIVIFASFQASAETRCSKPYAPDIQASATATEQQMRDMRDDTQAFIAASDKYQECVIKQSANRLVLSEADRKSIEDNQRDKERVGRAFNTALAGYNANHAKQAAR